VHRKFCDSLFELIQGHNEKTRAYVNRFIKDSRKVHNYNEKLVLAAVKKGFRDRDPGTLHFCSMAQNFITLQQFLLFTKGFIRGEEDAARHDDRRSPSVHSLKIKGVVGKLFVTVPREYVGTKRNLILYLSIILTSPLMPH
jgi:hypothetical protein